VVEVGGEDAHAGRDATEATQDLPHLPGASAQA
jgi:hypothetical protein